MITSFLKANYAILCLVLGLLLFGCKQKMAKTDFLDHYGTIVLPGNMILEAAEIDGLVVLRLFEGGGEIMNSKSLRPSAYQKWFVFYSQQNSSIWFDSSDIGLFVFTRSPNKDYEIRTVTASSEYCNNIPID